MDDGISLLLPTRKRPENLIRFITSAAETAERPSRLQVVVYIDDDDDSYDDVQKELLLANVSFVRGPRIVLSEMWNECYGFAQFDILGHMGDDIIFRSSGWDTAIYEEFDRWADKIVLVHGRDGFHDARLGTHSFIHRRWVEAVGYFVPPYFSSDYNDTWLNDVADRIGRRVFLPDVYTEHMHPALNKGPLDEVHEERLARHQQDGVDQKYLSMGAEREADAAKLREVMQ